MLLHVIDDQAIICEYITEALAALGHEALGFVSPVDYMDYFESDGYQKPEAILSDLSMPTISGSEMFSRIRQAYPEQNFVIVSGKPELPEGMQRSDSCKFLAKPFSPDSLAAVVSSFNA